MQAALLFVVMATLVTRYFQEWKRLDLCNRQSVLFCQKLGTIKNDPCYAHAQKEKEKINVITKVLTLQMAAALDCSTLH